MRVITPGPCPLPEGEEASNAESVIDRSTYPLSRGASGRAGFETDIWANKGVAC